MELIDAMEHVTDAWSGLLSTLYILNQKDNLRWLLWWLAPFTLLLSETDTRSSSSWLSLSLKVDRVTWERHVVDIKSPPFCYTEKERQIESRDPETAQIQEPKEWEDTGYSQVCQRRNDIILGNYDCCNNKDKDSLGCKSGEVRHHPWHYVVVVVVVVVEIVVYQRVSQDLTLLPSD